MGNNRLAGLEAGKRVIKPVMHTHTHTAVLLQQPHREKSAEMTFFPSNTEHITNEMQRHVALRGVAAFWKMLKVADCQSRLSEMGNVETQMKYVSINKYYSITYSCSVCNSMRVCFFNTHTYSQNVAIVVLTHEHFLFHFVFIHSRHSVLLHYFTSPIKSSSSADVCCWSHVLSRPLVVAECRCIARSDDALKTNLLTPHQQASELCVVFV